MPSSDHLITTFTLRVRGERELRLLIRFLKLIGLLGFVLPARVRERYCDWLLRVAEAGADRLIRFDANP